MITFNVGSITTEVLGLTGRARFHVKQCMTAKPKGYRFMPSFKSGHWDGNVCLLTSNTFPTGLLYMVLDELDELEAEYTIIDNRPNVTISLDLDLGEYNPRDYQIEAIKAALEFECGVLKMATNAGKTLVTAGIIKSTGSSALIIVPTVALLHQTADFYKSVLDVEVGKVGHKLLELAAPVIVTTMQSLDKVLASSKKFNTLIIDECHHTKAKTIFEQIKEIDAPIRIGVSGTPLTTNVLDDLNLMAATGPIIYEIRNAELIERGFSTKPIITFHVIEEPKIKKRTKYHDAYRQGIVENDYRNDVIASIAYNSEGLTLILVDMLDHVKALKKLMPEAVRATGNDDVTRVMQLMRERKCDIVVATNVFSEGVDIQNIDEIILAAPGVSHIRLLQRIGRGLRISEGKSKVIIHDFIDNTSPYLLRQSEARLDTYEEEGFEVDLVD